MKKRIFAQKALTRRQVGKSLAVGIAAVGIPVATRAANRLGLVSSSGRTRSASPVATLGILTLVNDSRTRAAAAGTPTRVFGWPFAPGQIPSGQAPIFTDIATRTVQPFSANPANARRYWADGSLMFGAFALRPTFPLAAGGSRRIAITSGGKWPSATRNITIDVYPQALNIMCPHSGMGQDPTTDWGAWLTSANVGNIVKTRTWLAGDAGDCWGFTINMSQTQGGAPHGLLVCDIYLHALTVPGGGLGGFRFWADLRQPYYDIDTSRNPAASAVKSQRIFAPPKPSAPAEGMNWSVGGGSPQVPPDWPFPQEGVPFTTISNGSGGFKSAFNSASPTYFGGGSYDTVPVIVTGNSLPAGLPAGTLYWIGTTGKYTGDPTDTGLTFFYNPSTTYGAGLPNITSAGSGSAVVMPVLQPFQRLAIGGADGEYIFFQGTGSLTAERPLRSGVVDQAHWVGSRMLPPYATNQQGKVFGGVIEDNLEGWNYPYNPYSHGDMTHDLSAAGNGPYIAPLPNSSIVDFYNGSLGDYRATLFEGLGQGVGALGDVVSAFSPTLPINLTNTNYRGVGSPATYWLGGGRNNGIGSGWNAGPHQPPDDPGGYLSGIGFDEVSQHWPNLPGWAYLRTGRLELLDRVLNAVTGMLQGNIHRNTSIIPGKTYYGLATGFMGTIREYGWAARCLTFATLVYPSDPSRLNNSGTTFDGSRFDRYLIDLTGATFELPNDIVNPAYASALFPSPPNAPGAGALFTTERPCTVSVQDNRSAMNYGLCLEWQFSFLVMGCCWGAVLGVPSCITFLQNTAKRWNYWNTELGGFFNMYHYNVCIGPGQIDGAGTQPTLWGDDAHWCISFTNTWYGDGAGPGNSHLATLTYREVSTPSRTVLAFTATGPWNNSYLPSNGDYVLWDTAWFEIPPNANKLPAGFARGTVYQMTDVTAAGGNIYHLNFADLSGNRIPTTGSGDASLFWFRSNSHQRLGGSAFGVSGGYVGLFFAVGNWAKAILTAAGLPNTIFDALIADALYRVQHTPGEPGIFLQQSPIYGTDARWNYQASFS